MALCLALETFGAEFVFDHVGVEPSGEAFNSLVELDNRSTVSYTHLDVYKRQIQR